jgi:D-hydroxyproline dehydrogenase subunit beta
MILFVLELLSFLLTAETQSRNLFFEKHENNLSKFLSDSAPQRFNFSQMQTFDVAIIGAGIVGAACAFRLSSEGLKVIVIEANEIAGGATAAGMGHIVVMDDSEAQFALTNLSQTLWAEVADRLPKSNEYQNCGTIWVAADDEEMQEVRRKHQFYSARGVDSEILDQNSLRKAEPNFGENLLGGLRVAGDGVVYQLCATKFFLDLSKQNGAVIETGKRVIEISDAGAKLENGEMISAGKVINAAGIGSVELIKSLEIVNKKGHLVITERYPNFVKHQLIEFGYSKSAHSNKADSVAFNVQPRSTEQLLIGSSRQFGAESKDIDYAIVRKMLDRAFSYIPKLCELTATRIWTGFRPATPDNLPYIGKCPGYKNIFVAAGHEGLGITTSLGTAEILTDEILGRKSQIDRKPYSPDRFVARSS